MKLSIVGTGMIAREALVALRAVQGIEVVCICARPHSREKAAELAREFGIAQVMTDYEEMLRSHIANFV